MATIKDGYYPYKDYKYDGDQDAYELMSKWTSSDTVYLPNNTTNLTTKLNAIDSTLDGIVDDVTLSSSTTWSSTKISNELSTLSADIDGKAELRYKVLAPYGSMQADFNWVVDMFEGFFSMSRNATRVVGIIDRWGEAITYITDEDSSFATVGFSTEDGRRKVVFQNNSNVNILVMYMADGRTFN